MTALGRGGGPRSGRPPSVRCSRAPGRQSAAQGVPRLPRVGRDPGLQPPRREHPAGRRSGPLTPPIPRRTTCCFADGPRGLLHRRVRAGGARGPSGDMSAMASRPTWQVYRVIEKQAASRRRATASALLPWATTSTTCSAPCRPSPAAGMTGDPLTSPAAARALVQALRAPHRWSQTTNLVAADAGGQRVRGDHEPRPRIRGLGARLRGPPQLDARRGGARPRGGRPRGCGWDRWMLPTLAPVDPGGRPVVAGAGAAGGSRIRSALAQCTPWMLRAHTPPQAAIDAPRLNAVPGPVRLEPGFSAEVVKALAADGDEVEAADALIPTSAGSRPELARRRRPSCDAVRARGACTSRRGSAGRPTTPPGGEPTPSLSW